MSDNKLFEKYCRRLEAVSAAATHPLLIQRANALRSCMDDGVVQEATAIETLHSYAKELSAVAEEWYALDALMTYDLESSSGKYAITKMRCHAPETARQMRGDFDGPHYNSHNDTYERRYNSGGYNEHPVHLEPRR